jgi:hypothetical protein
MRHEITKADNYLLVLDYKDVQPGDSFLLNFDHPSGRIRRCHRVCDNGKEDLLMIDPDGFGFSYRRECKRISAHLPLNGAPYLDGVDVLPRLNQDDEVDKLAEERFPVKNEAALDIIECLQIKQEVYAEGYNKAREKYKFTEEDMRKAIIMSSLSTVDFIPDRCDVIIQTIQQPKYPIAFECEVVFASANHAQALQPICHPLMDVAIMQNFKPKTITNSEGRTEWVGKYIYN